jgi:hypothetical protein
MKRAGVLMREVRNCRRLRRGDLGIGVSWRRASMARMSAKMVRSRVLPASGLAAEVRIGCCSIPGGRGGMDVGIFLLPLVEAVDDDAS